MGIAYQIYDQYRPHFLTFQVVGWADIFSREIYREILVANMKYYQHHRGLIVHAFVIMTNHMHVIWSSENGELSALVRDFKKQTSKAVLQKVRSGVGESRKEWLAMIFKYHARFNKRNAGWQLWTHENHAVEMDNNIMIDQRVNYIHENQVRAGWVSKAEDYLYSSASIYAGEEGVLEICKI